MAGPAVAIGGLLIIVLIIIGVLYIQKIGPFATPTPGTEKPTEEATDDSATSSDYIRYRIRSASGNTGTLPPGAPTDPPASTQTPTPTQTPGAPASTQTPTPTQTPGAPASTQTQAPTQTPKPTPAPIPVLPATPLFTTLTRLGGAGIFITTNASGEMWAIATNLQAYRDGPGNWTIQGALTRVSSGAAGIWGIGLQAQNYPVFHYVDSLWQGIVGTNSFSWIASGKIVIAVNKNKLVKWNGTSFEDIGGPTGVTQVSVSNAGDVWYIRNASVYQWVQTPGAWNETKYGSPQGKTVLQVETDQLGIFVLCTDKTLYQWISDQWSLVVNLTFDQFSVKTTLVGSLGGGLFQIADDPIGSIVWAGSQTPGMCVFAKNGVLKGGPPGMDLNANFACSASDGNQKFLHTTGTSPGLIYWKGINNHKCMSATAGTAGSKVVLNDCFANDPSYFFSMNNNGTIGWNGLGDTNTCLAMNDSTGGTGMSIQACNATDPLQQFRYSDSNKNARNLQGGISTSATDSLSQNSIVYGPDQAVSFYGITGKVVTVNNGSIQSGSTLVVWTGVFNWRMRAVGRSYSLLVDKDPCLALTAVRNGTAQITAYAAGATNQIFAVNPNTAGTLVQIVHVPSGNILTVMNTYGVRGAAGCKVTFQNTPTTDNSQWFSTTVGGAPA